MITIIIIIIIIVIIAFITIFIIILIMMINRFYLRYIYSTNAFEAHNNNWNWC